jgi:hypothetical protein
VGAEVSSAKREAVGTKSAAAMISAAVLVRISVILLRVNGLIAAMRLDE